MPRYYVVIDQAMPDPEDPWSLFRTPDEGGPPTELWNPETDEWSEEVSLIEHFLGDVTGHYEIPEEAVPIVQGALREREAEG